MGQFLKILFGKLAYFLILVSCLEMNLSRFNYACSLKPATKIVSGAEQLKG